MLKEGTAKGGASFGHARESIQRLKDLLKILFIVQIAYVKQINCIHPDIEASAQVLVDVFLYVKVREGVVVGGFEPFLRGG